MVEYILNAAERTVANKGANKALRREGIVPGVYYAKSQDAIHIQVPEASLKPLIYTSETHLISLVVENKTPLSCILKDVQFDPVTDRIVHFDLQGINKDEKIQIEVPVVLVGNAPGLKQGGLLQHNLHKLEIECLPAFMPEHIEVSVAQLNMNESIHIGDLSLNNIVVLNSEDSVIVSIVHPRAEKEAAGEEKAAEPELIKKGKAE